VVGERVGVAGARDDLVLAGSLAQVPRRCGEEVARVLTGQRPLNVVNLEVYAPVAVRRAR